MRLFVDTSAIYAILDRDDSNHENAKKVWFDLLRNEAILVTTNYILVETFALVQRRLGIPALRAFCSDLLPVFHQEWVSQDDHREALAAVLVTGRRDLSFVDSISFQSMRRLGLQNAFTFDAHFGEHGFDVIPKKAT